MTLVRQLFGDAEWPLAMFLDRCHKQTSHQPLPIAFLRVCRTPVVLTPDPLNLWRMPISSDGMTRRPQCCSPLWALLSVLTVHLCDFRSQLHRLAPQSDAVQRTVSGWSAPQHRRSQVVRTPWLQLMCRAAAASRWSTAVPGGGPAAAAWTGRT